MQLVSGLPVADSEHDVLCSCDPSQHSRMLRKDPAAVLCADNAEMAPPKWRGRLNMLVQCGTITGIVVGSAINIGANAIEWGWRIPLALAAFPGRVLLLG